MPMKRKGARRGRKRMGRKRKGGKFYKSKVGKAEVMVNRVPARLHNPVAPHFLTRLEYGYTGTINQAIAAGVASMWTHWANGLHFPGATTAANQFTAAPGPPGGAGVLFPATHALAALNPTGFSQLSVLYTLYRVYASRLTLTVTPQTSQPAFVCVYPQTTELPVAEYQSALAQPYSKNYTVSVNNNIKQNTISIYMDNPTILGLTKQQYNDLGSASAVNNTNPVTPCFWNIIVQPSQAATTLVGCAIDFRIVYYVEFFDPLPPADI